MTALTDAGVTIRDLRIEEVSLESLFTALTNGDVDGAKTQAEPADAIAMEPEVTR